MAKLKQEIENNPFETGLEAPQDLIPHPDNPRVEIDKQDPKLLQLANDIQLRGIIEPLVVTQQVTQQGVQQFILCGHRRQIASIIAGLETVPVVYRKMNKGELPEDFFLSENGHRENLSLLEEARAIDRLKKKLKCSHADLVRRLNMSSATIKQRLAILDCTEKVQHLFHKNLLPVTASPHLAKLRSSSIELNKIAMLLVNRRITSKELPAIVAKSTNQSAASKKNPKTPQLNLSLGTNNRTLDRESSLKALNAKSRHTISLALVEQIIENECCTCGMSNSPNVCESCPVPRIASAIAGRSDTPASKKVVFREADYYEQH